MSIYWANLLVNPILFAVTLPLPWFTDALGTLPEDVAVGLVWASVFVRLGWVTLNIALHPQARLLPHLLPRRKRWVAIAIMLLALLAYMQIIVLLALAGLWIDALRSLLQAWRLRQEAWPDGQHDRDIELVITPFIVDAESEHLSDSDD